MANLAGLRDLACRYQREAYWANAEAIDLHVALANMGKDPITEQPIRPSAEQIAMSRRFDEAARDASRRARVALLVTLDPPHAYERAA